METPRIIFRKYYTKGCDIQLKNGYNCFKFRMEEYL